MAVLPAKSHSLYQRGEAAMRQNKNGCMVPNIVETYQIEGSTIHICDNFIRTEPAEIQRVLDEYHAAGWAIVRELREKGEDI